MKKKKICAMFLTAAMTAALLAGCGNDSGSQGSSSQSGGAEGASQEGGSENASGGGSFR